MIWDDTWDETVDLLVVGTGAGAMTAAIMAHDLGATTLLIEKSDRYGGSSAMSGGALWIPNNHQMPETGIPDSREEALEYLRGITAGSSSDERLCAFVDNAPEMLRTLTEKARLRTQAMPSYTDYYAEAPGGKPGSRTVEAEHFDARLLGEEFDRLRESAVQTLLVGRVSMTATEAQTLLARNPGWVWLMTKIVMRYWLDIGGRLRGKRDRCLSLGNALVAMLRQSLMDRDVPIWLETPARDLIVEGDRVVGVAAERHGRHLRLRGRKGVLLAAGGFESSQAMRDRYLPAPTRAEWTVANPHNTGDPLEMALKLGAAVDLMDDAWWGPVTVVPGEDRARMLVVEKGLPGSIFVNKRGERFVNEASPYVDVVKAMYEKNSPEAPSVPAYMIFDASYRRKYQFGPFLPSAQQPDWALPGAYKRGYLKKARTLTALAGELGIDAVGLAASVERINGYGRAGDDLDFHRGENLFDRYYGDRHVEPNPCLAPIEKPPFYGVEVYPGDLGTKGGLRTDARARVLRESGQPIEGLYATGNCSASVMGRTYPGAGATIAPAMTFGYIAARDAVLKG